MFHPYWARAGPDGTLPRDMAWGVFPDKANLRRLYHECLVAHYGNNAAGRPIYQIPAPRPRPLPAPVVTYSKEGEASGSNPQGPKKPRKPRGPNKPRNPQNASGSAKKRSAPYASDIHMNYPPNKRLAAANDGDSIKSESRSTSIVNSARTTPTRQEPERGHIDLTNATPDGNSSPTTSLGTIDLTGMEEEMDRQTGGTSSSPPPLDDSASTTPVDDYYVEDQEDRGETERLLAEWQQYLSPSQRLIVQGQDQGQAQGQRQSIGQAQSQAQARGQALGRGIGQGTGQAQGLGQAQGQGEDQRSASPTSSSLTGGESLNRGNGNHGNDLQNSIEIDDGHHDNEQQQDAQLQTQLLPQGRESESTAVADQDMQMIGMGEDGDEMKVFDDDEFKWMMGVGAKGLSVKDAIVLD
jgi:hypothetical protein